MCGIFGVFGHPDAAVLTAKGLQALQHRGYDGAGLVSYDGKHFHQKRGLGRVDACFSFDDVYKTLPGDNAIGHVRYGTQGACVLSNIQPFLMSDSHTGGFALAHNGHFSSLEYEPKGDAALESPSSDTARLVYSMACGKERLFLDRFVHSLLGVNGAYACGILTPYSLMAACDPAGIRPLVLGRLGQATIIASETCALDHVGAVFLRDVDNGEVVEITKEGLHSYYPFQSVPLRPCVFEYIYFAHASSCIRGHLVSRVRQSMGEALGEEAPVHQPALVIPIPDSGYHAALGYARSTGIPCQESIKRNPHAGRTFLASTARARHEWAARKYRVDSMKVAGKSVVLVDDSLVRGITLRPIVDCMREAGVREIHLRIASPPFCYPDFYGLDLPNSDALLAAQCTHDEMEKRLGVDSLAFLSLEHVYKAFGYEQRNPHAPQLADHYFTGEYPSTHIECLKSVA